MRRQDLLHDGVHLVLGRWIDLDGVQLTANADGGVVSAFDVDVGGVHVERELEQAMKIFHSQNGQREIEMLAGHSSANGDFKRAWAFLGRSRNSKATSNPLSPDRRAH